MDAKTSMENLYARIHERLAYRDEKIAGLTGRGISAYDKLAEISRHIELLTADLRDALIGCHNELQALGYCPRELPMPNPPEIEVRVDEKTVRMVIDGMLPFPVKGGVHFLHEKLDAELLRLSREDALPRPLFDERCAVVFIHRYADTGRELRHLRDYDNVERRCITNVIARHFLKDDSPVCCISVDILAEGENNHTEVRIMTLPDLQAFILSGEIGYLPQGIVSKNVPKMYQKTHF